MLFTYYNDLYICRNLGTLIKVYLILTSIGLGVVLLICIFSCCIGCCLGIGALGIKKTVNK